MIYETRSAVATTECENGHTSITQVTITVRPPIRGGRNPRKRYQFAEPRCQVTHDGIVCGALWLKAEIRP